MRVERRRPGAPDARREEKGTSPTEIGESAVGHARFPSHDANALPTSVRPIFFLKISLLLEGGLIRIEACHSSGGVSDRRTPRPRPREAANHSEAVERSAACRKAFPGDRDAPMPSFLGQTSPPDDFSPPGVGRLALASCMPPIVALAIGAGARVILKHSRRVFAKRRPLPRAF